VTPGFRSSSYNELWNIWIDVDQNNVYDSDELFFSGLSRSAITDVIDLPVSAFTGTTGMRVSMRYGGYPPACGSFTYGEVEDYVVVLAGVDSQSPLLVAVEPSSNELSVATNGSIVVTFNEPIKVDVGWANVFKISTDSTDVTGTYEQSENSVSFTPDSDLLSDTLYRVELSTSITDVVGNPLMEPYEWSFTTAHMQDVVAPQVSSITPMMGQQDVAVNTSISVAFSEPIDPSTVTQASFSLQEGGASVQGNVTVNSNVLVFEPNVALEYETLYLATLSSGIKDLAGNNLEADIEWHFSTGSVPDIIAPDVLMTTPGDLMTGVVIDSDIIVNFSEEMSAASLTTSSFTLSNGVEVVQGIVNTDNTSATFSPSEPLEYASTYFATLNSDVADLSGNVLDAAFSWQFSTELGFSISGVIVVDGVGLANVSVSLSGESDAQVFTGANGQYTFNNLGLGNYLITPSKIGYEFDSPALSAELVDQDVMDIDFYGSLIETLNVPSEYSTIQAALDAAADGATILVDDGIYFGNFLVEKSVTIESVNGYQASSVVGTTGGTVFLVYAPDVTIKGFDVYGATTYGNAGIYFRNGADNGKALDNRCGFDSLHRNHSGIRIFNSNNIEITGTVCQVSSLYGIRAESTNNSKFIDNMMRQQGFDGISLYESNNNEINGNNISENRNGVSLLNSDFNTISSNACSENSKNGIEITNGSSNTLTGNSCHSNQEVGIFISESNSTHVHSNAASSNAISGIVFTNSDNAVVEQNQCNSNGGYGLTLYSSNDALITDNSCYFNDQRGFLLRFSDDNVVINNQFSFQRFGVEFRNSNNNLFIGNTVKSPLSGIKGCEIRMSSSSNNQLYQNSFISYTVDDVCSDNGSVNQWNTPTEVSYIFDGVGYSAVIGNYYSFADIEDSNGDGISELPLVLPGIEIDDAGALTNPIEDYIFLRYRACFYF